MKDFKNNKAITLVALIITIIVLLILAAVAISAVQGDGIIAHAKNARNNYQAAQDVENLTLANYLIRIQENTGNGENDDDEGNTGSATFDDDVTLTWQQLKDGVDKEKYGYDSSEITDTSIGSMAFDCNQHIKSIIIPNTVTSIEQAFSDSTLESITIPNSITSIESNTFVDCNSLESITIPNSVTSIKSQAFHGCRWLQSITIPSSVTSIENMAFRYCYSLTSVTYNGTSYTSKSAFITAFTNNGGTIGSDIFEEAGLSE